jgi:hypothetical protein
MLTRFLMRINVFPSSQSSPRKHQLLSRLRQVQRRQLLPLKVLKPNKVTVTTSKLRPRPRGVTLPAKSRVKATKDVATLKVKTKPKEKIRIKRPCNERESGN